MTDLRAAAQAVVAAFSDPNARAHLRGRWLHISDCVAALRASLEQPEQEPVARMHKDGSGRVINQRSYAEARRDGGASWSSVKNYTIPLYTHPPRREWQSLTEEEIDALLLTTSGAVIPFYQAMSRAIEAALKEKNHD